MTVYEIFNEYADSKDSINISIDNLKSMIGDHTDSIVLYGAGSAGIAFLHYLRDAGIYPRCFADGNEKKWGSICEGLEIIDYHKISERLGDGALVIVTINTDGRKYCKSFDEALRTGGHEGVHKRLREAGCKKVIDYTYFRQVRDLFKGDKYNLPSCSDVGCMLDHRKEIQAAYDLLADEESRDIFLKILQFRLLDDTLEIPTQPQDKQYFEYDFFDKIDDEVFVDCGAYNGISLRTFMAENASFERYYGFEPDAANYTELNKYVSSLPEDTRGRISIFDKAVYNHSDGVKLYSLSGPGSFVSDIGRSDVGTVLIDDVLDGARATFIKMNIEGSELVALEGASKTISMWKPRLAIAGYHKTWDLWEVPLLIHSINKDYRFYLRSYMNHLSFVYYGTTSFD